MNMALVGSVSLPAPRDSRTKLLDRAIMARAGLHFSWQRSMNPTRLSSTLLPSLSSSSSPLMNVRSSESSSASTTNSGDTSNMAILLEVEGVFADVHKFGHRRSFNIAFQEFNLECANWSEPVYADLLRHAGGAEESMLRVFFDRIGWPSSLPTNEKEAFIRNIMKAKQQALEKLAAAGDLSFRPGFTEFVSEVLEARVPLLVLAAYSKSGEKVARSLIAQLGPEHAKNIGVVGEAEVESSSYGQLVLGAGVVGGMDEQLAVEVAKAVASEKQRVAEEVANMLAVSVDINSGDSLRSKKNIAVLRAAAEKAAVDMDRCILLAGSQTGPSAASRIDMPCVVVRSSTTARADFPTAKAVLDGFGPGDITLARLQKFLN